MAQAFTAGVKPGGLNDNTQIRILLCYLVKVCAPVTREVLQGALMQEELVNYFEFADSLADVEKQGLIVHGEGDAYAITPKGETVADTLANDLPRTVRESAQRAVLQIQRWRYKAAMNRAEIIPQNGEYSVRCTIADLGEDIFRLELITPDTLTAEMVKNNFIAHGSDLYRVVMDTLTQYSTEDDRPPEALQ